MGLAAPILGAAWLATGGLDRTADRKANKLDKRATFAENMSMLRPNNERIANRAEGLRDRANAWQDFEPGRNIPTIDLTRGPDREKGPLGQGYDIVRDNVGNYLGYGGEGSAYQDWGQGLKNLGELKSNVTDIWKPGQQSIGGNFYKGTEKTALNTLKGLQNQTAGGVGGEVADILQNIRRADTGLDQTLANRFTNAASGGLSPEGLQTYLANRDLLQTQGEEAMRQGLRGISQNRGLWGSSRLDFQNKLASDINDKQNAALQNIMQSELTGAKEYALQKGGLENQQLSIAAQLRDSMQSGKLGAAGQALNQVQEAGRQFISQAQTQLQEQQMNIDNQFDRLKATMDKATWENEYNLANRKLFSDNAQNVFNNIFGLISGLAQQTPGLDLIKTGIGALAQGK